MTPRILVAAALTLVFVADSLQADMLKVRQRGKVRILGIKSKIEDEQGREVEIDESNYRAFGTESTGEIVEDNYDGIVWKDRAKAKPKFIPIEEVLDRVWTTEPNALLDGFDQQNVGSYPQAIAQFRDVVEDKEVRLAYRYEARFQIGICYIRAGSNKSAVGLFSKWGDNKSRYTPEANRILAELYTGRKDFAKARAAYETIGKLAGITPDWKLKAELGGAKVDIAQRKFSDGENTAKAIAARARGDDRLRDVYAEALVLQAKAILGAEDKDRLPAAEKLIESAGKIEDLSVTNRAFLNSTLGSVIYAQGDPDRARYPYLRVVLLYPAESSYVADALQNAGQCFLDLSGRATDDKARADELLIQGMKLLGECASRHRGSDGAKKARVAYRSNKSRYEAALKAQEKK